MGRERERRPGRPETLKGRKDIAPKKKRKERKDPLKTLRLGVVKLNR